MSRDDHHAPTPSTHSREEIVEFTADDGLRRRGFAAAPPEPSWPAPVVVVFHGLAGPTIPPGKQVMPDLVDELLSRDIGVLRYLPRVVELPRERAREIGWDAEIADHAGALRWAQQQRWVDVDEVTVLGMSLGGLAAPLVARRVGGVAGLASWGAGARPWLEYGPANLGAQLRLLDRDGARIRKLTSLLERWLTLLRDTDMTTEQILAKEPALARIGVTRDGYHERSHIFWRQVVRFDPAAAYQGLTCRVLAIRGEADCCSHDEDIESIVRAASAAGLEVTTATIPGIDHALRPATSASASVRGEVGEDADPRPLARCVAQWIRSHAK